MASPAQALSELAEKEPELELLVLFGSRATGKAYEHSDWDLAFRALPAFDPARFVGRVVAALGTERVDLVDLDRADALLRFRAARDGVALFERAPRAFKSFQEVAAQFWCDIEPVVRSSYRHLLEGTER